MIRKNPFIFILTLLLITQLTYAKPYDSSKVVIALNCGAKTQQISTSQGSFRYIPDQNYVKGPSVGVDYHNDANAVDAQIKFTLDKQIYMFERHTYQQMTYDLPVRKGTNTIILKFAQMYFQNKGQRVFNIKLGNKIILQNFDVIQKSGGKYAAHEEYIEIQVKNDGIYYGGSRVPQALENNKLKISFAKGKADNPIIQSIIIYHDSVENSPKKEFMLLKNKWSSQQQMLKAKRQEKQLRQLIQIQKKKEKITIRNDQLLDEKQADTIERQKSSKIGLNLRFVRSILLGPVGIVLWTGLFYYAYIFMRRRVFMMEEAGNISKSQ